MRSYECMVTNGINSRLLRLPDVINLTGLPRSTIYLKVKKKEFPLQIQISSRSVAWLESEVYAWINKNIKKRNGNG